MKTLTLHRPSYLTFQLVIMLKEFTMFTSSLEDVSWEGSMRICLEDKFKSNFRKVKKLVGKLSALLLSSRSGIFEVSKCLKRPFVVLTFWFFFEFCFYGFLSIFFVFFCYFFFGVPLRGIRRGLNCPL